MVASWDYVVCKLERRPQSPGRGPVWALGADALSLEEMGALPDPVVKTTDVLEWGFDLTVDHELTFETLDAVMDKHRIDITGLSLTSTSRGNRYRTYRLMRN